MEPRRQEQSNSSAEQPIHYEVHLPAHRGGHGGRTDTHPISKARLTPQAAFVATQKTLEECADHSGGQFRGLAEVGDTRVLPGEGQRSSKARGFKARGRGGAWAPARRAARGLGHGGRAAARRDSQ